VAIVIQKIDFGPWVLHVTILTDPGVLISLAEFPLTFERGIVKWNATVPSNFRHSPVSTNFVAYVRKKFKKCDISRTGPIVLIFRIMFLPTLIVKREKTFNFC
jgi:hypothetical protein